MTANRLERIFNGLGKKQRALIQVLAEGPIDAETSSALSHILRGLREQDLVTSGEGECTALSTDGRQLMETVDVEAPRSEYGDSREEILLRLLRKKVEAGGHGQRLGKKEWNFLHFIGDGTQRLDELIGAKQVVPTLEAQGYIEINDGVVAITPAGCDRLKENKRLMPPDEAKACFYAESKVIARRELAEKAEKFLLLYRQGFTYQEIGDMYEVTRERVRQILNMTPNFERYLAEYETSKKLREKEKVRDRRLRAIDKSLAMQHPDRVDLLWDWEKNGELNPADVICHSTTVEIWLRCPKDGHSWMKKPADIVSSWERSNSTGCPVCAGKFKKPERQPFLTETFLELVERFWDFTKNDIDGIRPESTTLASNRKVWFRCPADGHEWQASIAATVNQQWSRDNSGCRVCNGTINRRSGVWGAAPVVAERYPEQVAALWNFEKNASVGISPESATCGSSRRVWLLCPQDGHEWQAPIASVTGSWERGNTGCPACRGLAASPARSLQTSFPEFVAKFWDFEQNQETDPLGITTGSNRTVWLKCPGDGESWEIAINYLTYFWRQGKSSCPKCGRGRSATVALSDASAA